MAVTVIFRRKERVKTPGVPKHSKLFLVFTPRGRKHEQKHDQVFFDVGRRKTFVSLDYRSAAAARHIQMLAIRMLAVAKALKRLAVNLRGRHNPQNQPGAPLKI